MIKFDANLALKFHAIPSSKQIEIRHSEEAKKVEGGKQGAR